MNKIAKSSSNTGGMKVFHKGLILVLTPLLIEIMLIAALAPILFRIDRENINESRYRRCAALGAKMIVIANQAAVDIVGWFQFGSPGILKQYDNEIALLHLREKELLEVSQSDPACRKSARDLVTTLDSLSKLLDKIAIMAKNRQMLEMAAVFPQLDKEFKKDKHSNLEHVSAVTETQRRIAEKSKIVQNKLQSQQRQILIFGLLSNLTAAVALMIFFRKSISSRLQVVRNNTVRISEGRPLQDNLAGSDEIKQLDIAFHKMNDDLRLASERERSLFENASDVICVLNADNEIERINPVCKRLWGYEAEELKALPITTMVAPSSVPKAMDSLLAARSGGEKARFELLLKRKDGENIETQWSSYWSNEEQRLYSVVHDVSELKKTQRMKQAYMTIIGSDLKIPLSTISQAAERLTGPLADSLSSKALERMSIVKTNLVRLLALVNDLLEMSSLESGNLALTKDNYKVRDLLERSAHDLEGLAQKNGISFEIECSADKCYLDQNRIIQVIVNLASNAIKFSPAGAKVTLKAEDTGDYLLVKVIDQGRGVPESHKKTIFEKFKQVEASDGKRSAGTGLGLPICKDIVEEHAGEIGVDSEEGKGSTFWFRLPQSEDVYAKTVKNQQLKKEKELPRNTQDLTPYLKSTSQTQQIFIKKGAKPSFRNKGLLIIGIPLLLELVFVLSTLTVIAESNNSRLEELRQRRIAADAYEILDAYFKMFIIVSGSPRLEFWLAYDECCSKAQAARAEIARLVKNDPAAKKQFMLAEKFNSRLDPIIAKGRMALSNGYNDKTFAKVHVNRIELFAVVVGSSRKLQALMEAADQREAFSPAKQAALRKQQGLIMLIGLASNIALSLFLARFFSQNITSRLATLADNASRFSRGLPLNKQLSGNDEIAELDSKFRETVAKLSEARKKERAVFDNSQDFIGAVNESLDFTSSNPAAETVLGHQPDELKERKLLDIIVPEDREKLAHFIAHEDLADGKTIETMVQRQDGSSSYVLWSLARPSGENIIYCIAQDITEQKQLEKLKQEFLAVVSHDLRNPLGSVIGFVTLIKAGALGMPGDAAMSSLDEITDQADRLLELINDLLDLEKLEANGMQLMRSFESLGSIAYNSFESLKQKRNAIIDFPETNETVELNVDRERMAQVFSNIYTHILRRMRKQSNKAQNNDEIIKLKLKNDGNSVICEVIDPGPLYSEEEQERLFERFKYLDRGENSVQEGSALALPLARRIVEAHGGSFILKSDPSEGNVFLISLPRQE